jgi:hypothetical protein
MAAQHAAAKITRLNTGERPEALDALQVFLNLRAKITGVLVDADDVRLLIGEVKARQGYTMDRDTAVGYLEREGNVYGALNVYIEDSAGYEPETRIHY